MPQSHSAGKPGRVLLFDELRGLSILLVVIYHGAFDLIAVYGVRIPIFDAPLLQKFLQPLFAGLFVFISGAVSRYSRSNLRRGLACFACGLLITLVTGRSRWCRPLWHPPPARREHGPLRAAAPPARPDPHRRRVPPLFHPLLFLPEGAGRRLRLSAPRRAAARKLVHRQPLALPPRVSPALV